MELSRNHSNKEDLCHVHYITEQYKRGSCFRLCSELFSSHKVGDLLKKCNGTKEKGITAISLLKYKLSNVFVGRSMYMQQRTGSFKEDFCKNTFYRFLNSTKTNWLRFTSSLASAIINDEKRANVFIVDDTLFNRTSCKKTELGSRVFDHVGMKFRKGFRLLTLGWSDGNTFMPVNSCLIASSKESNIIGPPKNFDKVRMQYWKNIISQCQARPAGQTAKQYTTKSRNWRVMAKAAFGIMTILKTVYLAHLRQGNIEFSRFKYYFIPAYRTGRHVPAIHHKVPVAGKNFMAKQQKNFSVLHNINRFSPE